VPNDLETTLFGPRPSLASAEPTPVKAMSIVGGLGRILISIAALLVLLSAYLGFVQYWLQTHWIETNAQVVSVQIYASSRTWPNHAAKLFYGVRSTVSFPVDGKLRESQIDSGPTFAARIDAEVWASDFRPGGQVPILYQPPDGARVRPAVDSRDVTMSGCLRWSGCVFLAGLLAILASKQNAGVSAEPGA